MTSRPCCRSACWISGAVRPCARSPFAIATNGTTDLGEMRDLAVGLAVAHRRTVRPPRRVHQDGAPVAEDQAVVAAGRGVARHAHARRFAQARLGDELAHRRDAIDPRRECAVAGDAGMAELRLELRRQRQRHVDAVGRQEAGGAVGPLHHHDGVFRQIVEAELGQLRRSRHAVEVGMHHREARQLVDLHQREGRARHLDRLVVSEIADHRARECGLAGAEIAGQRQHVAGFERGCDVHHQPQGGLLVRQHHREARAARGGQHGCGVLSIRAEPYRSRTAGKSRDLP